METQMRWIQSAPLVIGLATLNVACNGGSSGDAHAAPTKPNILMILADDLGYSDIGAFGSEISTPNLDALVASGRVLTDYYTGAACSPTRSMLMSGTDHHVAGLGSMGEFVGRLIANNVAPWGATNAYNLSNLPDGYAGRLSDQVLSLPQLLQDGGYHTYMAGKWHLATMPADPTANNGLPFINSPASFPKVKGFERSYALLQGSGSHFAPIPGKPVAADRATHLEDDQPVSLPADFYSSSSYTDKIIQYLEAGKGDGRPFFAYVAYTAPHWPLQAPDSDIARYAGKYDEGYEVIRDRRISKQKSLGLIAADFHPNAGLDGTSGRPKWADLNGAQRAAEARKMEVYAAMVENMDRNVGRLIQYLKDTGRYDNTLIVFTSDNGAEGSPTQYADNANTDNSLANMGRPLSNVAYGERWAEVSATPFRLWKGMSAEGGVSAPMVVRLPGQGTQKPALHEVAHVSDLLPTFLEAAGIANPGSVYKGRAVKPITGVSLLARLQDRTTTGPRGSSDALVDELFTGRYVIRDGWKLVSVQAPFGSNGWELYDLRTDRGETTNVIGAHPALAAQLSAEYDAYAARFGVLWAPASLGRSPAP
jgi:arylsulfatase